MGRESFEHEVVVSVAASTEMVGAGSTEMVEAGVGYGEPARVEASGAWALRPGNEIDAVEAALMSAVECSRGFRTYKAIKHLIKAVEPSELVSRDVDVKKVVRVVLSVVWRDSADERRAHFDRLGGERVVGLLLIDRLPRLVRAAWFAWQLQLQAERTASGPKMKTADVRLAYATHNRMRAVLKRSYAGRLDEVALAVGALRGGWREEDIAANLGALAELYWRDDVRLAIEQDKEYREGDLGEALRLSGLLQTARGVTWKGGVSKKLLRTRQVVTLLVRAYEEHARCGRRLFAGREDVAATYPSLDEIAWGLKRN
jgi:hypothetical protein